MFAASLLALNFGVSRTSRICHAGITHVIPLIPCTWRFGEVGNAEEPRFGGALPRLRAFSLEGDRPRELDIRKPASQAMGEGALRSFYRRTAALGDAKADTIDWRWIVLAKWYRLAALGSP